MLPACPPYSFTQTGAFQRPHIGPNSQSSPNSKHNHGTISTPFQSEHLPLTSPPNPASSRNRRPAADSGSKQLLLGRTRPKLATQLRLHGAQMQADTHGLLHALLLQPDIQALDQLVHAGPGPAVTLPAAGAVVGDVADACGHEGHDRDIGIQ